MGRPAPLTLTFSVLRETAEPSGRTALLQTLPAQCGDVSSFLLSIFLGTFSYLHAPLTTYYPIDLNSAVLIFSLSAPLQLLVLLYLLAV